jgi:hypothetical protein
LDRKYLPKVGTERNYPPINKTSDADILKIHKAAMGA